VKLCTYQTKKDTKPRAGLLIDGRIYDIDAAIRPALRQIKNAPSCDYSSLLDLLKGGRSAMDAVRRLEEIIRASGSDAIIKYSGIAEGKVKLMAPLPRPNSIRDFLVFEKHLINTTNTVLKWYFPPLAWLNTAFLKMTGRPLIGPPRIWYKIPTYYKGNPDTVIGPGEPVIWPSYTEKLDYELEFGIYILGPAKNVSAGDAGRHIAGYTIFNDYSARDIQIKEMGGRLGPAKGKDFDTGNVMGPYLVTPDEVGDPYSLRMEAFVNEERWSSGTSGDMHFSFEEIIEYVSRSETLMPGDFFGSGTVGTGCGFEFDRWLKPGDRVTLYVDKLGYLSNTIVKIQ
jgi:2-keto-4-pentenoate hydratase/2-oxohepta-3-ene-1,7-dioic acid hydratase in catechol pathway